ncbi:DNA-binding transcriptional regulator, FadR family [Pseudarcicella hirudinis]|uniref:DNA-binding transcriptional regulator, FadR family n=2 Tax=Pseudarcicella hirudinis TaxID=1079859 RepID=A0A1I5M2W6_9BACT|nr:DNA-binding transcriptional regulator, FadR family [Pseudarcicella hirudinis]
MIGCIMTELLIKRKSLAEELAEKLQELISEGFYAINQKLPIESELMKSFGVGRSTVREAIKILVNSGYLRVRQGLGTFVEDHSGINEPLTRRLKRATSEDMDEVRELLEMKIAEKAALKRTQEDIEKISSFLEKRVKAAQYNLLEECVEADIQFHISIAEASKNDILADLYKTLCIRLKNIFLTQFSNTEVFIKTESLHRDLLNSIIDQDAKSAWQTVAKITGHLSQ